MEQKTQNKESIVKEVAKLAYRFPVGGIGGALGASAPIAWSYNIMTPENTTLAEKICNLAASTIGMSPLAVVCGVAGFASGIGYHVLRKYERR